MPTVRAASPSQELDKCSAAESLASASSVGGLHSKTSSQMREAQRARRAAFMTEQTASRAFSDQDELRTRVRNSLDAVSPLGNSQRTLYRQEGVLARVARSAWFEWCTLAIIGLNALWIAVDADYNDAVNPRDAQLHFKIADHAFCTLFVAEWLVRFHALRRKSDAVYNQWFLFDTLLVIMMVLDTWLLAAFTAMFERDVDRTFRSTFVLRVARLFRIMRLTRMLRLMRACPELIFLVRGMLAATRSVVTTMVLLFCILYAFGVAFRQLAADTEMGELYFSSVGRSMYTLLMAGTLLDSVGSTVSDIASESILCAMLFFIVILLAALTVMNMLIGVTCEVVSNVASNEHEKATVLYVKEQVYNMLWSDPETQHDIDEDHDFKISKEDFRRLIYSEKACETLKKVGVDVAAMVDLAEVIFQRKSPQQDFPKLEFGEFMDIVLQLRGSNPTTVKDLVDMRRYLHLDNTSRNSEIVKVQERQLAVEMKLESLEHKLDKLLGSVGSPRTSTRKRSLVRRNSADSVVTSPSSSPSLLGSPCGLRPLQLHADRNSSWKWASESPSESATLPLKNEASAAPPPAAVSHWQSTTPTLNPSADEVPGTRTPTSDPPGSSGPETLRLPFAVEDGFDGPRALAVTAADADSQDPI